MTDKIVVDNKEYLISKEYSWNDYIKERNKIKNHSSKGHFCLRCKNDTEVLLQTFTPVIYDTVVKRGIEFISGGDMSRVFYVCKKCGYTISVKRRIKR